MQASGDSELPDQEFLQALYKVCPNAVFFKVIPKLDPEETDSASETEFQLSVKKKPECPPLLSILSKFKCSGLSDQDALQKYDSLITGHHRAYLEQVTRKQSASNIWHQHRKWRITGSVAHDVLVSEEPPCATLLDKIVTWTKSGAHCGCKTW